MKKHSSDNSDDWKTPAYIYDPLNEEFHFDFDPCPLYAKFNGLSEGCKWGKVNFVNPPYSRNLKVLFVKKAVEVAKTGATCVLLLPVSTSTVLFHDFIKPNAKEIRFLRKRIKFEGVNTFGEFVNNKCPMHDSMIVVM